MKTIILAMYLFQVEKQRWGYIIYLCIVPLFKMPAVFSLALGPYNSCMYNDAMMGWKWKCAPQ